MKLLEKKFFIVPGAKGYGSMIYLREDSDNEIIEIFKMLCMWGDSTKRFRGPDGIILGFEFPDEDLPNVKQYLSYPDPELHFEEITDLQEIIKISSQLRER